MGLIFDDILSYIYIYVRPSFWCISHIYLDLLAAVLDICHLEKAQRLFSASKTHRAWLSPKLTSLEGMSVFEVLQLRSLLSLTSLTLNRCHVVCLNSVVPCLYTISCFIYLYIYVAWHANWKLYFYSTVYRHICVFRGGGAIISSSFLSSQRLHPQNSNFFNLSGCFQK